jgi:general secretion pathway protein C
MENLARRHFWLVDLAAIVVCAVLTARAVSLLILAVFPRAQRAAAAVQRTVAAATYGHAKTVDGIVARHIFWSARPRVQPRTERTSLPLRLLAVMYAPGLAHRRWSMAIIRDDERQTVSPCVVGSTIGGATVVEIEAARVDLDVGGGHRAFLDLVGEPANQARPWAGTAAGAGVTRTGEHAYRVPRTLLDAWLGNLGGLATTTQILPELREGQVVGFRLSRVRPQGPLAAIGLREGDVLLAINGLELISPDEALLAFTKLRRASHISLAFERDGGRITNDYDVD